MEPRETWEIRDAPRRRVDVTEVSGIVRAASCASCGLNVVVPGDVPNPTRPRPFDSQGHQPVSAIDFIHKPLSGSKKRTKLAVFHVFHGPGSNVSSHDE